MAGQLTREQWDAIRRSYEFDADEPSQAVAAARAGALLGFTPPSKMAVSKHARQEKWERRGSLTGVNRAAQRRADRIVQRRRANKAAKAAAAKAAAAAEGAEAAVTEAVDDAQAQIEDVFDDEPVQTGTGHQDRPEAPEPARVPHRGIGVNAKARIESEDLRAEVLARHRQEWRQIAVLRQEAVKIRDTEPAKAAAAIRFAKLTAEVTGLQQTGERRAWGLDEIVIPDLTTKSDAELVAILEGRKFY